MAIQVNITNTKTSYNFDVRDEHYVYTGSYSAGTDVNYPNEVSCSITKVEDGTHVGNLYYTEPNDADTANQFVNFSLNASREHFDVIYPLIPTVIAAVENHTVEAVAE